MKKRFNLSIGYLQAVVLGITLSLFLTSCLRQTKNNDVLKISTQSKKQSSKKISQVSKKALSKKNNINIAKNDTVLIINEEIEVANQVEQESQMTSDSSIVNNIDYSDSIELENYFAELEKVEVDSSDFVLIKDY
ncbi:MAG: hypothetical protein IPH93_02270 [Saprospiraceae bacterium]|nr:hypothetical protein [Saprospiraceae bacterium]MBK7810321.1 hypothetical protein [Saprospiraceae bacterium]